MELATLATYVKQSLLLMLMLSMPAILASGIVGLIVAFLQAVTQIQDQTIAFAIKLVATIVAIALTSAWLGAELLNFTDRMLSVIPSVR